MPTALLVRHGRTKANADGVLAGWTPGVVLDERGVVQAEQVAQRLATVPLAALIASPLERTQQTADAIAAGQAAAVVRHVDERFAECRYGDWTGRPLKDLAKEPMWKVVQGHPSAAVFPGEGGESMIAMQHRAVSAVREWNDRLGETAVYAVVSHGDVIKAILADALGMHLDQFQRISVDPCSVSVVSYTAMRPFVVRMNDLGSDLSHLGATPKKRRSGIRASDAAGGGGSGQA
ncbi:MAG: MSMEG_4193 family putative phosphomutase [Actinomycetales bacterium]